MFDDLDAPTVRATAGRVGSRRSVRPVVTDATLGAAAAIVRRAGGEDVAAIPLDRVRAAPLPGGPYDVVVADLFLTQLLYPALHDAGLPRGTVERTLADHGQDLTDAVVERLHAAAPGGVVVWVHDLLGWWAGHEQPFGLDAILDAARTDPEDALALAATGRVPRGCDPRAALARTDAEIVETAFWRWPFARGADYLVCATVARRSRAQAAGGVASGPRARALPDGGGPERANDSPTGLARAPLGL